MSQCAVEAKLGEVTPNPTTGIVDIPLITGPLEIMDRIARVNVYDVNGDFKAQFDRTVHANEMNHLWIDGSGWSSGTYLVRIYLGDTILNTTFILRK